MSNIVLLSNGYERPYPVEIEIWFDEKVKSLGFSIDDGESEKTIVLEKYEAEKILETLKKEYLKFN